MDRLTKTASPLAWLNGRCESQYSIKRAPKEICTRREISAVCFQASLGEYCVECVDRIKFKSGSLKGKLPSKIGQNPIPKRKNQYNFFIEF